MFKKTTVAILATLTMLLSTMASAVSVAPTGSSGQVLIFPLYNVNNGFITSYNITNTTDDYKAVKFRFRESENSNDVLDFNAYLSPKDVFTLSLKESDSNGVLLSTNDNSCTHPTIPKNGVEFRHGVYDSTSTSDVREGYLEVIEMGVLDESAVITNRIGLEQNITIQGILHDTDGMPFDCSVIEQAWKQGVFTQGGASSNTNDIDIVNPKSPGYSALSTKSESGFYGNAKVKSLSSPTGGIVGSAILIDTKQIAGFVAEPLAINNYSTRAQHYLSSDQNFYLLPSLASGNNSEGKNGDYDTVVRDWGLDDKNVLPRTSVPSGINPLPVADVLLVYTMSNQYFLGTGTFTDWVISAPMRKHGIYNGYKYNEAPLVPLISLPIDAIAVNQKSENISVIDKLSLANSYGYWSVVSNDVSATFEYYDREEQTVTIDSGDFSPPRETESVEVILDREVNIFTITLDLDSGSVLGSENSNAVTLASGFENGWAELQFSGYNLKGSRYAQWYKSELEFNAYGVPLQGFMAARGQIGLQYVGETFPHSYK